MVIISHQQCFQTHILLLFRYRRNFGLTMAEKLTSLSQDKNLNVLNKSPACTILITWGDALYKTCFLTEINSLLCLYTVNSRLNKISYISRQQMIHLQVQVQSMCMPRPMNRKHQIQQLNRQLNT